jgi:sulfhydrogenase subunit beta (sulfur reductase)
VIIKADDFITFLRRIVYEKIGNYREIYLPARGPDQQNGHLFFTSIREDAEFELEQYRTVDPVKILFYLFREQVLNKNYNSMNRIIAGVKACDLKAIQLMDKALINNEFTDPSYKHWRDHTTIISTDCDSFASTCHCTLLDGKPYPEKGFDINLSPVNDFYFIQVGTEKGRQLIDLMRQHINVQDAASDTEKMVQAKRNNIVKELSDRTREFEEVGDGHSLRKSNIENWENNSGQCIGCGACTNICPTCYCLILNDESGPEKFIKTRSYDSCQLNGYAKVAGGGTPRPKMTERFRNRYLCKFSYMKSNFEMSGCTGCGRCIDACPGSLDLREVTGNVLHNRALSSKSDLKPETGIRREA